MSNEIQGWLYKEGHFIKNWKKRWIILRKVDNDPSIYELVYYSDERQQKLRGVFPVHVFSIVTSEQAAKLKVPQNLKDYNFFQVKSGIQILRLACASKNETLEWLRVFRVVQETMHARMIGETKKIAPKDPSPKVERGDKQLVPTEIANLTVSSPVAKSEPGS